MAETERVINDLNVVKITLCNPQMLLTPEMRVRIGQVITSAIELLKEQEPHELTKEEWEKWKKDKRRDPICMIFYGDTTSFWVLKPEEINEPLYLMRKIKLFTKKPPKEQVKWDD